TRFSRDWSSDVCSSDLVLLVEHGQRGGQQQRQRPLRCQAGDDFGEPLVDVVDLVAVLVQRRPSRQATQPVADLDGRLPALLAGRSEERRVGKEWGSWWC